MGHLEFAKMQAAGNDFVVVDATEYRDVDWPMAAQFLCRRHFGIGSDGLMTVGSLADGGYRVRMFDPDGSEDFCGNGTRCAAVFAHHQGMIESDRFTLSTKWGELDVQLRLDSGRVTGATIGMGRAAFDPKRIPCALPGDCVIRRRLEVTGEALEISAVSTGTTHTVVFDSDLPSDARFLKWSARIEHHPVFPEQTNVLWAVVESPQRIHVRIWERGGVGESLACGTGACAIAAVGQRLGLTGDRVTVVSNGGELHVTLDGQGEAWLTGPANRVFAGKIQLPMALT